MSAAISTRSPWRCGRLTGPSAEVADFFERALGVWTSLLGLDHPEVGLALNNLGEVNRQLGHPERAMPLLQRALAIAETSLGPTHPRVAMALNNLGLALFELGQEQEGIEHLRRAVAIAEANLGPEHAYTHQYQVNLTSMLAAV